MGGIEPQLARAELCAGTKRGQTRVETMIEDALNSYTRCYLVVVPLLRLLLAGLASRLWKGRRLAPSRRTR